MIRIDGSKGEGGGQIIRTSLALSILTGQAIELSNIRARRNNPGLARQHLTAVQAAARVASAAVEGDKLGSTSLRFEPQTILPGEYHFDVRSAGSATLVLQTILPPLIMAKAPSRVLVAGGTHNMKAPPFDFLDQCFFPVLRRMGVGLEARLIRHGFFPAGGGSFELDITPPQDAVLKPITMLDRGRITHRRARALIARLPVHVAERELKTLCRHLGLKKSRELVVEEIEDSQGPGNVLLVELGSESGVEIVAGFGRRGVKAEEIAKRTAKEAKRFLDAKVPVGEHLADQLLLPMALAGAGEFRSLEPSSHTQTNIATIQRFLPVKFDTRDEGKGAWRISLG